MIKIVMEENPIKKKFLLLKLQTEMEEHALPKRKLPGHKRKKIYQIRIKIIKKIAFKKHKFFIEEIGAFL